MEAMFLSDPICIKMKDKLSFLSKLPLIEQVDVLYNMCSSSSSYKKYVSEIERVSTKSSEKALEYKESGNKFFCHGEFIEALKCYTKCAAFAPPNSPELAFAYANRSATLYRLEKFETCLVDTNRALNKNYPQASMQKLIDRKKNCLAKLRELKKAEKAHLKLVELTVLDDDTLKDNVRFHLRQCEINNSTDMNYEEKFYLPEVNFKNKTISNVTEKVSLKYSAEFGRHIVATKDINAGEVIAIEKPYASVLSFKKKYTNCANCFVKCESLIPCPNCSSALFFSKSCLQNAYNCFHRIECQILSLHGYPVEANLDWLVIRLLMIATKQGKDVEALMTHPIFKYPLKKLSGEFPDRFESDDYYNIHNLEDHFDKKDPVILMVLVRLVPIYMLILKNTSFFDELCEENKFSQKDKERYVTYLLVKLSASIFNGYMISEHYESQMYPVPPPTKNDGSSGGIGSALYSFHSLFNHSCANNVNAVFHKDVLVSRALDPIKAGEQLFMTYGTTYDVEARDKRQEFLRQRYLFTCHCVACEQNWPLFQNLVSIKLKIMKHKELYQCWKALEDWFAPGVPKHQYSAKLFNLLCEFLTLMLGKIDKPNREHHECQQRLIRLLVSRSNYYESVHDKVVYSL